MRLARSGSLAGSAASTIRATPASSRRLPRRPVGASNGPSAVDVRVLLHRLTGSNRSPVRAGCISLCTCVPLLLLQRRIENGRLGTRSELSQKTC